MSNLPQAREVLQGLLLSSSVPSAAKRKIKEALSLMYREPAIKRAPVRNRMSRQVAIAIRKCYREHRNWSHAQIAKSVGIDNIGRVSEVLNGKRYSK